jgi:gluconokinase
LWCYRVDAHRSLLGGALNDVGRVISWLNDTVQLADTDLGQLMTAAPEPTTPLVLPYLSGERSTGWAAAARAVVVGASTATTGALLFRAAMEGVALSYQRITDSCGQAHNASWPAAASPKTFPTGCRWWPTCWKLRSNR